MEADVVEIMDTWLQARLEKLHTTMPGTIQSYDPKTRTATVVPGIRFRSLHGESIAIKPIPSVPVVFTGCKRFSVIPANMEQGDGVILHFSESAMGNWMEGDGVRDAEDETRFSLHDCIAVVGLWSTRTAPDNQDLGSADFGLVGSRGEVLGGQGGKLDLRNDTSDLRAQLEALCDAMTAIDTACGLILATGSVAFTPYVSQSSTISSAKEALQGLLA